MTAEEVKALRLELGLSQSEFGELLGYTKPQTRISELENGKKIPSNQVVVACQLLRENRQLKGRIEELKKILGQ